MAIRRVSRSDKHTHAHRKADVLQQLAQWCHSEGRERDTVAVLAVRARVLRDIGSA